MRLQRASRLFRLARIGRLAKLTAMKKTRGFTSESAMLDSIFCSQLSECFTHSGEFQTSILCG